MTNGIKSSTRCRNVQFAHRKCTCIMLPCHNSRCTYELAEESRESARKQRMWAKRRAEENGNEITKKYTKSSIRLNHFQSEDKRKHDDFIRFTVQNCARDENSFLFRFRFSFIFFRFLHISYVVVHPLLLPRLWFEFLLCTHAQIVFPFSRFILLSMNFPFFFFLHSFTLSHSFTRLHSTPLHSIQFFYSFGFFPFVIIAYLFIPFAW